MERFKSRLWVNRNSHGSSDRNELLLNGIKSSKGLIKYSSRKNLSEYAFNLQRIFNPKIYSSLDSVLELKRPAELQASPVILMDYSNSFSEKLTDVEKKLKFFYLDQNYLES